MANFDSKKTIMLVEDEALLALLGKKRLEKYGYSVVSVNTGEKAVLTIGLDSEIDLVLMDINLGSGMDGTQAAQAILEARDLPLIFLSSHTEREVVEKTEGITSYGYIVKDSGETVLIASIKMAFRLFEAKLREREKESALRESEERYHLIDEASRDCVYSYDRDGRFTHANTSLCRLLSLTPDKIIGKTHEQLGFPAEQCADWDRLHRRVIDIDSTVSSETMTPIQGSAPQWFEVILNPMHDASGSIVGIAGTTRDITERKRLDSQLRESRRMLQLVLDTIPVRVFWKDLDLNYLGANRSLAEDAGISSPEEIIGKNDHELCWHGQADLYRAVDREVIATGFPKIHFEEQQTSLNGETRWLRTSKIPLPDNLGNTIGIMGMYEDITASRKSEHELQLFETRLNAAMEAGNIAWWEMTYPEGSVTFHEKKARMLGYPSELFHHYTDFTRLLHSDDHAATMQAMLDHLEGRSASFDAEYRIRTADGNYRWFRDLGGISGRDDDGKPRMITGIVIDIDERKRAEESSLLKQDF